MIVGSHLQRHWLLRSKRDRSRTIMKKGYYFTPSLRPTGKSPQLVRFLCLIHCISSFFADRSVKRKQPSWKDVSTSFSYFPIPLSTLHTNEDCLTIGHLFLTPLLLHNSFRQIYREERRSLSLKNEGNTEPSPLSMNDPCSSEMSCRRHTISRVVVEHKDYFETFYELDDLASLTHQTGNTVFFDNDGFWSGSITWY